MKECMNKLPQNEYNQLTSKFIQIVGNDVQINDYESKKMPDEDI